MFATVLSIVNEWLRWVKKERKTEVKSKHKDKGNKLNGKFRNAYAPIRFSLGHMIDETNVLIQKCRHFCLLTMNNDNSNNSADEN